MGRITSPEQLNADTWDRCDSIYVFCEYFARPDLCPEPPSDRKFRLLIVAALRVIWEHVVDPRSRSAVEVAERHADEPDPSLLAAAKAPAEAAMEAMFPSPDNRVPLAVRGAGAAWDCVEPVMNDRLDTEYPGLTHWSRALLRLDEAINKRTRSEAIALHIRLLHEVIPNPFRPMAFDPTWRTSTATSLARTMYASRDFAAMPILADALEEAGCDSTDILAHCRGDGPHVRGCRVVDLVLGKA